MPAYLVRQTMPHVRRDGGQLTRLFFLCLVGGYTSVSWASEYWIAPDMKAFLFNNRENATRIAKFGLIHGSKYFLDRAVQHGPNRGPMWGHWPDLSIFHYGDKCICNRSDNNTTYAVPEGYGLAGKRYFYVDEVEVFAI